MTFLPIVERELRLGGVCFQLLAGTAVTADCLSEEKRDGTLGPLFLTDLRGYDVVLGKLVATALPVFYSLVAAIPVLALPFWWSSESGQWLLALVATVGLFLAEVTRSAGSGSGSG